MKDKKRYADTWAGKTVSKKPSRADV